MISTIDLIRSAFLARCDANTQRGCATTASHDEDVERGSVFTRRLIRRALARRDASSDCGRAMIASLDAKPERGARAR